MGPAWGRARAALMEELGSAREQIWLVGGCVRDTLLGLPIGDVDLVTTVDPGSLAGRLHDRLGASIARLPRSVRAVIRPLEGGAPLQVDISALESNAIEGNLRERDFTINAMALPLRAWPIIGEAAIPHDDAPPDLLDPTGGYADLTHRVLRAAGPTALRDDPGRIIRGARCIARFELTPTDETLALAEDAAPLLRDLSADRLHDEMNLLLEEPRCAEGMAFLERTGALSALFPELAEPRAITHALDSLRWTARLQQSSDPARDPVTFARESPAGQWYATPLSSGPPRVISLRWGLLLHALTSHEVGGATPPRAERGGAMSGFRRLPRGPERRIAYEVEARASFTARLIGYREPDERDLRRLFAVAGEVTVDVLVAAAACANAQATEGTIREDEARVIVERVREILDLYFAEPARLIPPPLLTGRDVIKELGIAPGPEIHRLLALAREAQLDGRVSTHAEALALVAGATAP